MVYGWIILVISVVILMTGVVVVGVVILGTGVVVVGVVILGNSVQFNSVQFRRL